MMYLMGKCIYKRKIDGQYIVYFHKPISKLYRSSHSGWVVNNCQVKYLIRDKEYFLYSKIDPYKSPYDASKPANLIILDKEEWYWEK